MSLPSSTSMHTFWAAKDKLLELLCGLVAIDGIVEIKGPEIEQAMVPFDISSSLLLIFIYSLQISFIQLAQSFGFTKDSPEVLFLRISCLLIDYLNRIPEDVWHQ